MKRRQFLKLGGFVSVTLATGGLTACGGGDDSPAPGPIALPQSATGSGWKFPQSIASGDPRADRIVLWTRVVPSSADDVLTATNASDVSIQLLVTAADNASLLGTNHALQGAMVVNAPVPAYARYDNTVRNVVTGLNPATTYYYQFVAGDVRSKVGRFKTAPAADADVAQLRFGVLTCQDWSVNHWGAYDHIARNETFDFVLHLGDYIYETVGADFQAGAVESVHKPLTLPNGAPTPGSKGGRYAITTADYRYLYKTYRTDPRLQAVHERFALIAIWDDHEFTDDCWRDAETYTNGSVDAATGLGDNTRQSERRRSANQAWFEYMPADVYFGESIPGIENIRIYRDFRFGKLAHVVMTDERLYRTDHVIPEAAPNPATGQPIGSIGARYFVPQTVFDSAEAAKISGASRISGDPLALTSILGKVQRDWWKSTLQSSNAIWKFWGNEVSLLRMGVDGSHAIATLLALNSMATLATQIGTTAGSVGGNVAVATAIVALATSGVANATAAAAATAMAAADASSNGNLQAIAAAAVGAGVAANPANMAAQAYLSAQAGGAAAGAQVIAFGWIKPDIARNGASSPYTNPPFLAADTAAGLKPFFTRFLLNCDQWDGFNAERRDLMKFVKDNGIRNLVAVTGDIHAFFAGEIRDDFDAPNGGTPVAVDLVTAGVSSDSFFSYLASAVVGLSQQLATLVYQDLSIPVPGLGSLTVRFNLLDYTMGKPAPASAADLAEQVRVQVRGALAQTGAVPEAALDATTAQVLVGLQTNPAFSSTLLGLAQQLASLNSNPWLKHLNNDAQGYMAVTVTPAQVVAEFRQVNHLVGRNAPSINPIARVTTATVLAGSNTVSVR
jgi:alkaline phosphatase D